MSNKTNADSYLYLYVHVLVPVEQRIVKRTVLGC